MASEANVIYIGCFGGGAGAGRGVTVVRQDPVSGRLTGPRLAAPAPSPSFLASHPARPVLYAACDPAGGQEGLLSAWSRHSGDPGTSGELRPLGSAGTGGEGPCHVALHPSGRYALTANYGGGSVAVHRLDPAGVPGERTDLVAQDGSGPDRQRQQRPHPHLVAVDPDGAGVHVVDLGADAVFHYRLDTGTGRLHRTGVTTTRPGTGPRHAAGTGSWRYLVGELAGTLTSYRAAGDHWEEQHQVPIRADAAAGYASEVAVSADGRFVYVATRGPDRIAVFAAAAGRLRPVTEVPSGGAWPRHLALAGPHMYVANERSHRVVSFRVDPATGIPVATGDQLETPSPSCVLPAAPIPRPAAGTGRPR